MVNESDSDDDTQSSGPHRAGLIEAQTAAPTRRARWRVPVRIGPASLKLVTTGIILSARRGVPVRIGPASLKPAEPALLVRRDDEFRSASGRPY